jgi:hypothetical protein
MDRIRSIVGGLARAAKKGYLASGERLFHGPATVAESCQNP